MSFSFSTASPITFTAALDRILGVRTKVGKTGEREISINCFHADSKVELLLPSPSKKLLLPTYCGMRGLDLMPRYKRPKAATLNSVPTILKSSSKG